MATYNTGNPVPSAHPLDLYDNSEVLDEFANSTSHTQTNRLGVEEKTLAGIRAESAAGTYTVGTLTELNAIVPPTGTKPAGRVTTGADAGLYLWSGSAWVKTVDPLTNFDALTINKDKDYPMKAVSRGGTAPSDVHPVWNAGLVGARIEDVEADTAYRMAYYGNGNGGNYGVTVYKMPMSDLTAQTLVVTSTASPAFQFDRAAGGIQMRTAIIAESIRLTLVVDVDQLPPDGTFVTSLNPTHNGYNSIIDPSCYFLKANLSENALSINANKDYPLVAVARGGTAPQNINPSLRACLVGADVLEARNDYFYRIGYYGNGVLVSGVANYGVSIYRIPKDRLAEGYEQVITSYLTSPALVPDRVKGGIQTFEFACVDDPQTRMKISFDVDKLPPDGTQINASSATNNGFNSIIDPSCYTMGDYSEWIEGDLLIDWNADTKKLILAYKSGSKWYNVRYQRKSVNQTFTILGFGFDDAYKNVLNNIFPVQNTPLTSRTEADSDFIGPMIFTRVTGGDAGAPTNLYTGGSHGTENTAGDPTSEMKLLEIYVDGTRLDQTRNIHKTCKFVDILTQQDVQASNTTISKTPAAEEYVSFNISPKGVFVHKILKALYDLQFTADNACQCYMAGMASGASYLLWGASQAARANIVEGTPISSGPKSSYPEVYGVSIKHAVAGEFNSWVDPFFGVGDRASTEASKPLYESPDGSGKIYPRLFSSAQPFSLKAGDSYEWRGGFYWGMPTNTANFDTVQQVQDGVLTVKPNGKYEVRNDARTTRKYVDERIELADADVLSEANSYTDDSVAVVNSTISNLEKYGVENPLLIYEAGATSGVSVFNYAATEENGLIVLTSTGTAGTGRLSTSRPRGLSPLGMVFRFTIKKVSGKVPDYVLSVTGTLNSTPSLYGAGRRVDSPEFVTYEVDISTRADGSAWTEGETIYLVNIALSSIEEGDTSSVYHLGFISYGYRDTPYPVRYPDYESSDTPTPTPDPVIGSTATQDRAPLVSFDDPGGYFVLDENGNEIAGPNAIAALVNRIDAISPGGGAGSVPQNPVYIDDGVVKIVTESGEETFMDLTPHQFQGSVQWNGKYALTALNRATIGAITPVALSTGEDWIGTKLVLPCGTKLMIVIISFGQSNSVGAQGNEPPAVLKNNLYPENLLMCDGPVSLDVRFNLPSGSEAVGAETELDPDTITHFKPLVSMRNPSLTSQGATMMESMAYTFGDAVFKATGLKPKIVVAAAGWGGRFQSQLAKGSIPYNNFMTALTKIKELAEADGYKVFVPCVPIIHGESDSTRTSYLDSIKTWQSDFSADIKAITGQLADVPFLCTQASTFSGEAVNGVLAPWLAAQEFPGRFFVSAPYYSYSLVNDLLHLGPSSPIVGEKMGHTIARISGLFGEHNLGHLQPVNITYDGDRTIDVEFYVPTPPLVRDTTDTVVNSPAPENWGFVIRDGSSAEVPISSVSLLNATTVRIVTASSPAAGASRSVDYALSGFPTPKERGYQARGQLRDSTAVQSIITDQPLYDWCVHFRKSF